MKVISSKILIGNKRIIELSIYSLFKIVKLSARGIKLVQYHIWD